MILGVPKEIKDGECRVAVTPSGVRSMRAAGHACRLQSGAGRLSGFEDAEYRKAGARVVRTAAEVWAGSDLVLKVKEPQKSEVRHLAPGKMLFCYLHLAADPSLTRAILRSGATAVALETIRDPQGRLPLLEPMSEIAGRMAAIVGAYYLGGPKGGRGVLVSGLPGVLPARFVVVGAGTVGENAARIAAGMGAQVTVLDNRPDRLRLLDEILPENASTLASTPSNLEEAVSCADVIIGSVLIPGARAPKLITRKVLRRAPRGSVLVDVCIDQGGVSETSRPTSHSKPTYVEEGVLHYCVPNMPGAYGRTATAALSNVMLPYVLKLASGGLKKALCDDPGFAQGLNAHRGRLTSKPVADSLGLPFTDWQKAV